MTSDVDGTKAALQGTALDGLPIEEAHEDCLRIDGIEPRDVLSAWRAARAALPTTGRWPIFSSSDDFGILHHGASMPLDLAALDVAARSIDPWPQLHDAWADEPMNVDDLWLSVPTFEGADLPSEAARRFDAPTTLSVDRWVYDRILADPRLLALALPDAERVHQRWHQPSSVQLWLLPTPHAHLAAAWADYHGTLGQPDVLAAVLWQWHQVWGAELVAAWGLVCEFSVGRRPALGDEAWELARQQKAFANHLEEHHWEVALALTQGNEWVLYDRP